jgi:hypothetical protein
MAKMAFCLFLWLNATWSGPSASGPQSVHQWSSYHNRRYDFCIRFPTHWQHDESLNGDGTRLAPGDQKAFRLPPLISAYGGINQPSERDETRLQDLEEIHNVLLRALAEHWNAVDVLVWQKRYITVQGVTALDSTFQYKDSSSGKIWVERSVDLIYAGDVYSLDLKCSPEDAASLRPIFERILQSLRLHCNKQGQVKGNTDQ